MNIDFFHVNWLAVLIPLTVTALVLTIAYNPQFALLMSKGLTLERGVNNVGPMAASALGVSQFGRAITPA